MAKGDHRASANKVDEQQQMAQSYLTGVQGNIGNQYGRNNALYWGPNAPTYGSINNWGTTVPNYSPYGPSQFPDSRGQGLSFPNTGPISNTYGGQQGGGYQPFSQDIFNQIFPGQTLTPQMLDAAAPQLAQYGVTVRHNAKGVAGKIKLPSGETIDVIQGAGGGINKKQWLEPGMGGGFGIGAYGPGGIPGMSMGDYQKIAGLYGSMLPMYQGLYGDIGSRYGGLYGDLRGQYGSFLGSAADMATTGGLSEADKANLRARAISPIRSVYSQGLQNLERQRALQGGYSPGFTTALGRFNREQGQLTSDATTNAEAAIAEMVQRGKLGGLGAWGSGLSGMGSGLLGALGGMTSGQLGALGGMNQSIGGMSGLFGTQPGMGNFFANQLNNSIANQLTAAGLQNQLGLGVMGARNYIGANVPGNFASTVGPLGGFIRDVGTGIYGAGVGAAGLS